MSKLLTKDDFIDLRHKIKQRGLGFILSKLNRNSIKRTESAFNQLDYQSADWWIIPSVRERWNYLITGQKQFDYKQFFIQNLLNNQSNLRLISIGSGSCKNEIEFAKHRALEEVVCIDLAKDTLQKAEEVAKQSNLKNIQFICADVNKIKLQNNSFDIVFFNASLHHFNHIDEFIETVVKQCLKPNGMLVINEFVGATRLQYSKNQLKKINEALKLIPNQYKTRYKSNILKQTFSGSGLFRMILADPSECIDSARILPTIHSHFETILEQPYGGNILMNVLKDISHHFVELNDEKQEILQTLFDFEDEYLTQNSSDFVFGIYKKNE